MESPLDGILRKVLKQMKEEGKMVDDFWEEYYSGTNTTYSFSIEMNCYTVTCIDIIAASFYKVKPISEQELVEKLKEFSLEEFKEKGFVF